MIKPLLSIVIVAGAVWFGWRWLFPNDEARITAVLEQIADSVSAGAAEGDVARLARAAGLRDLLAPDVTVDAGPPIGRLTGREAIIGAAARRGRTGRDLQITFPDIAIDVAPDRQSALATVTVEARYDDGGGPGVDARELEIGFTRLDDNWVISTVTLLQPLQRLQ